MYQVWTHKHQEHIQEVVHPGGQWVINFWPHRAKLKQVALTPHSQSIWHPWSFLLWSPCLHLNGAPLVMLMSRGGPFLCAPSGTRGGARWPKAPKICSRALFHLHTSKLVMSGVPVSMDVRRIRKLSLTYLVSWLGRLMTKSIALSWINLQWKSNTWWLGGVGATKEQTNKQLQISWNANQREWRPLSNVQVGMLLKAGS